MRTKKDFYAAIRFLDDENLVDRVYWYRSDFSLAVGELVLAPVGIHDRLQLARVERTIWAEEREAPYDIRLVKSLAEKYGCRKMVVGRLTCYEAGGVKYDDRHYTRLKRVLVSPFCGEPTDEERESLKDYGVTEILPIPKIEDAAPDGCVLYCGEDAFPFLTQLTEAVRTGREIPLAERLR
jgi:hypothetical protein